MNRNRRTASSNTTDGHSNYVETGWADNKWMTEEMAQALDSTNGMDMNYYGANGGHGGWNNVNAPQPFRPNPTGIDFTTGQPKWN
jgi:hypothetical protein